jgi:tRNA nucleotidyltransferase (CCA-adding enzyme)
MDTDRSWGAVVFDGRQRFLLVLHASGNHWDHPKGHPEKGETPKETALREIREEALVSAEIIGGFETGASWTLPDGRPKRVVYFLARCTGAAEGAGGNPEEILGTVWLPYQEARERITYSTGKEVLDRARNFLLENPEIMYFRR